MDEDHNKIPDDSEVLKESFIARLREKIEGLNLSLVDISKHTGVPKSNIHSWLCGTSPNLFQAAKVARFLGSSLDELILGIAPQDSIHGDYLVRVLKRVR